MLAALGLYAELPAATGPRRRRLADYTFWPGECYATPMTLPSQDEATEQFARVFEEIERLNVRFAQRPQAEKKRLGQLQKLLTKLRRLKNGKPLQADGHAGEQLDPISADERKLLESLTSAKKS